MSEARKNVWQVWEAGQVDPQYHSMLLELRVLEKKYDAVLETLPTEQQDIISDFVSQCESMSWRLLEIACQTQE